MTKKAFSTFKIKAIDEAKRVIRGIASTPTPDRSSDIVVPEGAKFTLPLPLLWQHNHDQPIGSVTTAKVTSDGIEIEAELVTPTDDMPSGLIARLEEAYHSIKTGLVRGFSIGFRPIKYSYLDDSDGIEFTEWDFYELSAVTIPANAEATILNVKHYSEQGAFAKKLKTKPASGRIKSVKLNPIKGNTTMKYAEIIKRLEATRQEKLAERDAIQKAVADEGRTKDAAEREAFDTLQDEVKAIDLELKDLRELEKANMQTAKPVERQSAPTKDYSGVVIKRAPEKLEKGIAFARFAQALGHAQGNVHTAQAVAKSRFPQDTRLHHVLKAAVNAGNTTDANFAKDLVEYQEITTDFVDFLRPKTIIGQFGQNGVPALRPIPFNVTVKGQSSGGTAGWVGEGEHKPLTAQGFEDVNLGWFKLAAITAATDELLRFSNPSAEQLIRDDIANAVSQKMNESFIQIANGGGAASPASITNSLTTYTSGTGDPEADIAALWTAAVAANYDLSSAVYITTPTVAMGLAGLKTAADNKRFPDIGVLGGHIDGIPVIVSNSVDAGAFVLAFASEIWLADDGQVTLDASREASLIMDSDPQAAFNGDSAKHVNMFQTNQVAFRAERYVNWKKRRTNAVAGVDTSKAGGWK